MKDASVITKEHGAAAVMIAHNDGDARLVVADTGGTPASRVATLLHKARTPLASTWKFELRSVALAADLWCALPGDVGRRQCSCCLAALGGPRVKLLEMNIRNGGKKRRQLAGRLVLGDVCFQLLPHGVKHGLAAICPSNV